MRFRIIKQPLNIFLIGCMLVCIASCTFLVKPSKPVIRNIYFHDPKQCDSCFFITHLDLSEMARYRVDSLRIEQKYLQGTLIDLLPPQSDDLRFSKKYFEGWRPVMSNENIYLARFSKQMCSSFKMISKTDSLGNFKIKLTNNVKSGILIFGDSRLRSMSYLVVTFK